MRYILLDYLKFFSISIMIIYHYFFIDALVYGAYLPNFNDALLDLIRIIFISVSGFALALSYAKLKPQSYFVRRIAILVSASSMISVVTYFFFPHIFIYFGIIHFISAMNLIFYAWNCHKRFLVLLIPAFIYFPSLFHREYLTRSTLDYFPLLPNALYFILGYYCFKYLSKFLHLKKPNLISRIVRHALTIYLLHPAVIFIYLHLYYKLI